MDVTELGATFMENFRLGGDIVNQSKLGVNNASDFEKKLKAFAPADASATAAAQPSPEKKSGPVIDKTDELYKQCVELEIFMVKTLITSMRNTIQKTNLIDEGFAGKMYEDMLYDEYTRTFTQNANLGMAELAYLELTGQRGKVIIRQD